MSSISRQLEIRNTIIKLYKCEFPDDEKRPNTKEEIIDYFVKRLMFCDKIKPKSIPKPLTNEFMALVTYSDTMRIEICKDILKHRFSKDIQKKYNNEKLLLKSTKENSSNMRADVCRDMRDYLI